MTDEQLHSDCRWCVGGQIKNRRRQDQITLVVVSHPLIKSKSPGRPGQSGFLLSEPSVLLPGASHAESSPASCCFNCTRIESGQTSGCRLLMVQHQNPQHAGLDLQPGGGGGGGGGRGGSRGNNESALSPACVGTLAEARSSVTADAHSDTSSPTLGGSETERLFPP